MKKGIIFFSIFLFSFVSFYWVSSPAAYKGSFTVAFSRGAVTMDPHVTSSGIGWTIWRWSYDPLVTVDGQTGELKPWLAERWEKLAPTKYKFWLRKGVKFADGTPLTAAAIDFSIKRIFDPELTSLQRGYWKGFDRIEILDDHTLIWHLKRPDNGLLQRLSRFFLVMSPKVKEMPKRAPALKSFGSGPYVLKTYTKGIKMVFEANPTWWGNDMYPNRPATVTLRGIRESTTRVKSLITGEVDAMRGPAAHQILEIEKNSSTAVSKVPSVRFFYLSFVNGFGGPFADEKVRQAVLYAIDIEIIKKTILGGLGEPIGQFFHPWSYSGYSASKKPRPYNLAKAKALMKSSAHPKGFKATLVGLHGTYPFDKATAEAMAGMLKKIGIDVHVNSVTFPLYRKLVTAYRTGKKKGAAMIFRSWGTYGDSPIIWRSTTSCKGIWSVSCFPELDAQNEKAAAMADPKLQQAAFEKLTDMMQEKAAMGTMFRMVDVWGYNKKGLQFQARGDENLYPWEVSIK